MTSDLLKFQALLPRHSFVSVKTLAKRAAVSVPTVYRRLRKLLAEGAAISETKSSVRRTGPVATMYRLEKAAP